MSQHQLEYTCIQEWFLLQSGKGNREAWYTTLPLVIHDPNVSHVFLWFVVSHYDDICAGRKHLPKSKHHWAYVDFALQLISQRRQEISECAQNLSTANALCHPTVPQ